MLTDLARLERAVTEVFDAPQSPAWPADAIERMPEEAWETAVLKPVAALRVLSFAYPVNAYLQSVKAEEHDHPDLPRRPSWVAVYRKNYEVWRLDLGRPAYEFLQRAHEGPSVRQGRRGGGPGPPGQPRRADLPLAARLGRRGNVRVRRDGRRSRLTITAFVRF